MGDNGAVYAFVGWVASNLSYGIFIFWAMAPDSFLRDIGITYYPSRYYALALPAYALVVLFLVGVMYMAVNMIYTHDPSSIHCVRDEFTRRAPSQTEQLTNTRSIPEIGDSDIRYISYIHSRSNPI